MEKFTNKRKDYLTPADQSGKGRSREFRVRQQREHQGKREHTQRRGGRMGFN